jgi:hypothetical protein
MAERADRRGYDIVARKFREQVGEAEGHAQVIRDVLLSKRGTNTESQSVTTGEEPRPGPRPAEEV